MSIFSASECAIGLANTIGTLKATKILQCNVFGLLHADAGSFEREKKMCQNYFEEVVFHSYLLLKMMHYSVTIWETSCKNICFCASESDSSSRATSSHVSQMTWSQSSVSPFRCFCSQAAATWVCIYETCSLVRSIVSTWKCGVELRIWQHLQTPSDNSEFSPSPARRSQRL